eukprot:scaffold151832_cov16-Tisochrysis_lutea.AAC.1
MVLCFAKGDMAALLMPWASVGVRKDPILFCCKEEGGIVKIFLFLTLTACNVIEHMDAGDQWLELQGKGFQLASFLFCVHPRDQFKMTILVVERLKTEKMHKPATFWKNWLGIARFCSKGENMAMWLKMRTFQPIPLCQIKPCVCSSGI